MNIGLYFGTFNPIHIGHMAIANYMLEFTGIDQLWFVVSPQSPFKQKQSMLDDYQRLELVNRAIGDDHRLKASSIEFKMPKPSFTIDTLTYLKEEYPANQFWLIMGSDNLEHFHKWKNSELILENHPILVYPRPGFDPSSVKASGNIHIVDAPIMEISATFIRESLKAGKDIRYFIPERAWQYIEEMNFYRK